MHLQLDERSWVDLAGKHSVAAQWRVPPDSLLKWIDKGSIAMGAISLGNNPNAFQLEVVVKQDAWAELSRFLTR